MQKLIPTVARYWPFANGSGRILDKYAKGIDLGTGERVGWTSDGFPLHVYAEELIGRHILMSGGSAAPDKEKGSILTGAGYRIYGIDKRLFRTALVPFQSGRDWRFNDYFALG